ncbi:DUF6069 family protein [Arthrobacter sp. STN4]|uniref:DUF6069 family protein n=1 Tax=Arthrobacter sp. STN4 TaxID=2923276 RepID=UPI00211A61BA|nr:DUF6069 family protein [Arthrobacter sp. STN4]MCQ9164210.1 DUF6069 family protein [Arthrobacter sp. STN4]
MPHWSSPENDEATARPTLVQRAGGYFSLERPRRRRQPAPGRFLAAAAVAIIGSLAACAAIVAAGTATFPAMAGYEHFRFLDYAKLTVPGVALASLAWPVVTLFTPRARLLFAWLTVVVTMGGLAPDLWILYRGAPPNAVLLLVVMHLALAAVTYPALVFIAPQKPAPGPPVTLAPTPASAAAPLRR